MSIAEIRSHIGGRSQIGSVPFDHIRPVDGKVIGHIFEAGSEGLWKEEVFGPIALVAPFDTVDEALRLANDSPFGLQGSVFTRDLGSAFRFVEDFDVGALWINEASRFRLDLYPFGGVKQSGVGREGIRYAIDELSQIKFIGMRP